MVKSWTELMILFNEAWRRQAMANSNLTFFSELQRGKVTVELKNIWKEKKQFYALKFKIMKVWYGKLKFIGHRAGSSKLRKVKNSYQKGFGIKSFWKLPKNMEGPMYLFLRSWILNMNYMALLLCVNIIFGHISRKKNHNSTKTIAQGKPVKSCTAYVDNIKQWTGLSMHRAFKATQDRDAWRQKTRKAMQAANTLMDEAAKK